MRSSRCCLQLLRGLLFSEISHDTGDGSKIFCWTYSFILEMSFSERKIFLFSEFFDTMLYSCSSKLHIDNVLTSSYAVTPLPFKCRLWEIMLCHWWFWLRNRRISLLAREYPTRGFFVEPQLVADAVPCRPGTNHIDSTRIHRTTDDCNSEYGQPEMFCPEPQSDSSACISYSDCTNHYHLAFLG